MERRLRVNALPCAQCGTPFAEVVGGALVIRSKHHGREHVNVLTAEQLRLLLGGRAVDTVDVVDVRG